MIKDSKNYLHTLLTLSKNQKKVYNLILDSMRNGGVRVLLPPFVGVRSAAYYIKLVIAEHPELSSFDACVYSYSQTNAGNYITIPSVITGEQRNRLEKSGDIIIKRLIKPGYSDIKKALIIHDFLVNTTSYDHGALTDESKARYAHTAYGAVVMHKAVCEGIAYAYSFLLKKAGIRSTVVDGLAGGEGHAWNIIEVGGEFYHVDATWNINYRESTGDHEKIYDYFCLCDDDLGSRVWDRVIYPKCDSRRFNYFQVTGTLAHNDAELTAILERQIDKYDSVYLKQDFLNLGKDELHRYIYEKIAKIAQQKRWGEVSFTTTVTEDVGVIKVKFSH